MQDLFIPIHLKRYQNRLNKINRAGTFFNVPALIAIMLCCTGYNLIRLANVRTFCAWHLYRHTCGYDSNQLFPREKEYSGGP